MKKQKRLGIVGGMGPETSCKFCLNINNKFRKIAGCQPDIVLENLPVSMEAERKIIRGETTNEHFDLLMKAVGRLNKAEVDFMVIPCNTVHVFIDELRKKARKPILSIIEESAEECGKRKLGKAGLLATTKTVEEGLYRKELERKEARLVLPGKRDQKGISRIIIKIVQGKANNKDKQFLLETIERLKEKGAEAVILGCTDLGLLVKEKDCCLPVLDTLSILEDKVVKNLGVEKNANFR